MELLAEIAVELRLVSITATTTRNGSKREESKAKRHWCCGLSKRRCSAWGSASATDTEYMVESSLSEE